ncbi:dynamin family protein [Actinoplanes utahensis]|uniref:GTP-binding protein n=1 Tax=Actinoplanes utahensis TaxID=1869 RepID=A0A0A6U9G5_ACTUT|nr:dynamin family protein [Actinoplanes utahensis]KHD72026.1 GTP-binding protein [Actinoplanes utahensis]GIF31616.1 GTPase [Actinoplanes utahensis]
MTLLDSTRTVLDQAIAVYHGTPDAARLAAIRDRLGAPLRVAVAGRIKAGKSTLLNALVGERLAPTDAGECTRIVTWYRDGPGYQVHAYPRRGDPRQLRFTRDGGAIDVDLGGLTADDVAQLVVTWPAGALRTVTLIDTPGIGSLSEQAAQHTWDLLVPDDEETPADAVVYLLRHLHPGDVEFLRAFHDTEVSRPSPVNAIGVLSRADEIGAGRLDSMASARRIAARLGTDANVRRLVQSVVPVAGLLAETAVTLTETEVAHLRRIAGLPVRQAEDLLLSADRFVGTMPEVGLTSLEREGLLARFGLFGVRLTSTLLRREVATTAAALAKELAERSGLTQLREIIGSLFLERRDVLKSRSALLAVAELTRARPRPGTEAVTAAVEEIMASAHPFNELRVLSSLRAGWITGRPEAVAELERLIGGSGAAVSERLHLPPDAPAAEQSATAQAALARWQRRAENPMTPYELAVAARVAVRTCEGILSGLGQHR